MDIYKPAKRRDSIENEQLVLAKFLEELDRNGYSKTNLARVGEKSGITRPGIIRRFGSKQGVLNVLYQKYCEECTRKIGAFARDIDTFDSLDDFIVNLYVETEKMHSKNRAINLAMSQIFYSELVVHAGTREVFKSFLVLFEKAAERAWFVGSKPGSFAATQLLISTSLNYSLGAMGGLPGDQVARSKLVAKMISEALHFDYSESGLKNSQHIDFIL